MDNIKTKAQINFKILIPPLTKFNPAMKRIIAYLLIFLAAVMTSEAKYTLYSFSGDIIIKQSNRDVKPERGMELNATDEINIPQGAQVEIYNTVTKEIFTSVSHGLTSVMGIMLDARKQSQQTAGAINDRMRFSALGSDSKSSRLYTEGLVKRSMQVYDPEAENLIVAPDELALHILKALRTSSDTLAVNEFPTDFIHTHIG